MFDRKHLTFSEEASNSYSLEHIVWPIQKCYCYTIVKWRWPFLVADVKLNEIILNLQSCYSNQSAR